MLTKIESLTNQSLHFAAKFPFSVEQLQSLYISLSEQNKSDSGILSLFIQSALNGTTQEMKQTALNLKEGIYFRIYVIYKTPSLTILYGGGTHSRIH